MSLEAATQKSKSIRSKEYKEECRLLLERTVTLQLKVFKAPDLYVQEVLSIVDSFKKEYEIVKENPGINNQKFIVVAQFLSKVCVYYKSDMVFYVEDLMELINNFQNTLHPNLRKKIIFNLLRVRGKGMIEPFRMIVFLMKMFNTQDKDLRRIVHRFIFKDIKQCNKKGKNDVLNKQIQNFIVDLVKKSGQNIAKRALQITIELYRKNIWKDNKVINIIAQGCFSQNYKIKLLACSFLIETTETREDLESSESEDEPVKKNRKNKSVKPTKAREHRLEKEKKNAAKKQRKRLQKQNAYGGFFPLDLIYSPQDFADRMFECLKRHESEKFTVKMAMMHVISRLINRHKLILIPFYSYIQKYLLPNGKDITKLFCFLAESIHQNIPKEDLDQTMKHLIDQFVNDRCSEQTLTMGLKTVYEIVQKHPQVLDKFNINYLAHYIKYKNKNVSQSARALLNFYRTNNPQLLDRKYRGKQWKGIEELDGVPDYIIPQVLDTIDGAELLQEEEDMKNNVKSSVPIYLDRMLTDEDFKRIRALRRKKEAELETQRLQSNKLVKDEEDESDYEEDIDEEEDDNFDDDIDEEEEQDNDDKHSDISEISGQNDNDDWQDEDEDEDNELDPKQQNKKRRQSISELEDSVQDYYSDDSEQIQDNPHGFINEAQISHYKKTKAEQKQFQLESEREKWYAGPNKKKNEHASKTNKEKLKNKPMAMVRAKKVQEKNKEKDLKSRIKDLKNKLGHVRSGKQAQKLKKVRLS